MRLSLRMKFKYTELVCRTPTDVSAYVPKLCERAIDFNNCDIPRLSSKGSMKVTHFARACCNVSQLLKA